MRILVLLAAALCCGSCSTRQLPEVGTVRVKQGDLVAHFSATGRVQADLIKIAPLDGGRLLNIQVKENDVVQKGQVLAQLDDRDLRNRCQILEDELAQAQSRRREAELSLDSRGAAVQGDIARARGSSLEAQANLREVAAPARRPDLEKVQAELAEAVSRETQAERDLQRTRQLYGEDIVSRAQLEADRSRLDVARASTRQVRSSMERVKQGARPETVGVAQAKVSSAHAQMQSAAAGIRELDVYEQRIRSADSEIKRISGNLALARLSLERTVLRAPCQGVVAQILVLPGEVVSFSQPVLNLQRSGDRWIEAQVEEQDASLVHPKQKVQVRVHSNAGGGLRDGLVRSIAPALEPRPNSPGDSKILRLRVDLVGDLKPLMAGTQVDVEGEDLLARDALLLPRSAVHREEGKDVVYVLENSQARRRQVTLGASTPEQVEVRMGVSANDVVIGEGENLADGREVRARP